MFQGDKVLVTIKGEMKKGILVGCHQDQPAFRPKFDSNNVVLIDDNGKYYSAFKLHCIWVIESIFL